LRGEKEEESREWSLRQLTDDAVLSKNTTPRCGSILQRARVSGFNTVVEIEVE
jgi:hypothetical protein